MKHKFHTLDVFTDKPLAGNQLAVFPDAETLPDDSLQDYLGQWDDPPYVGGKGYIPHFKPKSAYAATSPATSPK